jgi:hypothetical protein
VDANWKNIKEKQGNHFPPKEGKSMKKNIYEKYRGKPPLGYLKEWRDKIVETTNTTAAWALTICFTMLATFVPNAYLVIDGMPVSLNIWALFIAPPAQYSKSRPLRAFPERIIPSIENVRGLTIRFPSSFTPEAVSHFLNPRDDEDGSVQIVYRGMCQVIDEYSSTLKRVRKDYMADLFEQLTLLYDGIIEPNWTVTHGVEAGVSIYLCVLGATSPDFLSNMNKGGMSHEFFRQGLGSRFLYIYRGEKPPHRNYTYNTEGNDQTGIATMAKYLTLLDIYDVKKVEVGAEAVALLHEYCDHIDQLVDEFNREDNSSVYSGYIDRQKINLHKLAALHCINRNLDPIVEAVKESGGDTNPKEVPPVINLYDVEWAIGMIEDFWADYQEMISAWQSESMASEVLTINRHKERVRVIIKRSKHGIVKESALTREMGVRWDTMTKVLQTMVAGEELYVFPRERIAGLPDDVKAKYGLSGPGKPSNLYSLEPFPFGDNTT